MIFLLFSKSRPLANTSDLIIPGPTARKKGPKEPMVTITVKSNPWRGQIDNGMKQTTPNT